MSLFSVFLYTYKETAVRKKTEIIGLVKPYFIFPSRFTLMLLLLFFSQKKDASGGPVIEFMSVSDLLVSYECTGVPLNDQRRNDKNTIA